MNNSNSHERVSLRKWWSLIHILSITSITVQHPEILNCQFIIIKVAIKFQDRAFSFLNSDNRLNSWLERILIIAILVILIQIFRCIKIGVDSSFDSLSSKLSFEGYGLITRIVNDPKREVIWQINSL
jgi:hypothetical protein